MIWYNKWGNFNIGDFLVLCAVVMNLWSVPRILFFAGTDQV